MHSNSKYPERLVVEIYSVCFSVRVSYSNLAEQEVDEIKKDVLACSYVLSPFQLVILCRDTADAKFLQVYTTVAFLYVIIHLRLLLTALARLLNQTKDSGSVFLDNSFAFRGKESFLQEVRHFGSVGMLCYVDLTPSARTINRSRLMSKLQT